MNKVISALTNRYLLALMALLFVVGMFRRFAH